MVSTGTATSTGTGELQRVRRGHGTQVARWSQRLGVNAGLCVQALSSSCPPLGRAPELCQLCGWALWLGFVSRPCPPLVLVLAAPLNSVWALWLGSLPRPCPPLVLLLAAPELCQLCGWALWLGSVSRPCPPCPRLGCASTPCFSYLQTET